MSKHNNKKYSEFELLSRPNMNKSIQSNNNHDSSLTNKKLRLRSKTIFAFQDDHINSNIYSDDFDEAQYQNLNFNLNNQSNDPYYIPHNNMNNSNFFSICDKSQWLNNTTTEKNHENDDIDCSICSITEDMERYVGFLNEVDDDLNDAKLSLNEEGSLMSEKSSTNQNTYFNMNMTTPINQQKLKRLIESEDMRNMNTNINTQQSFSSFLTNVNYATSNGSSFFLNEDKKNRNNLNMNIVSSSSTRNNIPTSSTHITQVVLGSTITTDSYLSNGNNQNVNDLHAKSVDFNSQSPFKITNTHCNSNKFTNCNEIETLSLNGNYYTTRNNVNPNQFLTYSFCLDNNMVYKGYYDSFNKNKNINAHPVKFNPNDDKNVLDNLMILIKDQNGCRLVQKKIEEKKEEFFSKFYDKIINNIIEVINDPFGNYVIQKFVDCSVAVDKSYIPRIIDMIKSQIFSISTNSYGTRAFQKLLDYISTETEYSAISENLQNKIYNLIQDTNGNHVVQKLIQVFPCEKIDFIVEEISVKIKEISQLKQGSCIFQKIIEHVTASYQIPIIQRILSNISELIDDEFGNFIIQNIIKLEIPEYVDAIFSYVKENFVKLSKRKFSSNVIDKCILLEDATFRCSLIDRMIELKCVGELVTDQFGNYVVQKALKVTNGIKFIEIIEMIKKSFNTLKSTNCGRKIYEKLMKNYGDYLTKTNKPTAVIKNPTPPGLKKDKSKNR